MESQPGQNSWVTRPDREDAGVCDVVVWEADLLLTGRRPIFLWERGISKPQKPTGVGVKASSERPKEITSKTAIFHWGL
jgi:hypothetical protein